MKTMSLIIFSVLSYTAWPQSFEVESSGDIFKSPEYFTGYKQQFKLTYQNKHIPEGSKLILHYGVRRSDPRTVNNPLHYHPEGGEDTFYTLIAEQDWTNPATDPLNCTPAGTCSVILELEVSPRSGFPRVTQLQFALEIQLKNGKALWDKPGFRYDQSFYYVNVKREGGNLEVNGVLK